ncbi:MAG: iron-containing alcohol dehydrogenase family protein [Candidatus Dormibacteria bacterium]
MTYGPDLDFSWRAPTRVIFGRGRLGRLGKEALALGATRVLVVTDPFLAGETEIVNRACDSLRASHLAVEVFSGVESDPSIETIDAGVATAREFGPDLLVGLGGGSAMDAAKAIDMLLVCGDSIADHLAVNSVRVRLHPVVTVPTTAGTGAETSFAAVISDRVRGVKIALAENAFLPSTAILDPELTIGLPAGLTAATGMDAHAHAIDVIHSTRRQPYNDALAFHVIRTVHTQLRVAVAEPENIVARGQMLAAACSMGFSLSTTPYGIIHALGHPLGAHFKVHHGIAVAALSCPGMKWNLVDCTPIYAEAARACGLSGWGTSDELAAAALIDSTEQLMHDLDLPQRLSELGVTDDALERLAADAMQDIGTTFNLRRAASPGELRDLYRSAL